MFRKRGRLIAVLVVASAVLCALACVADQSKTRLIVELKPGFSASRTAADAGPTGLGSVDGLCERFGFAQARPLLTKPASNAALAESLGLDRTYVLVADSAVDMAGAVDAFSADPHVAYAEPDVIGHLLWEPNDPYFSWQYAFDNWGQTGGTPGADINAVEGWDYERGGSDTIIAILDTGIDYYHPEFAGKIVQGLDLIYGGSFPLDDFGHGTHVAGIAAALTNNSQGVAGTAPGCPIMPVKVVDWLGEGEGSLCAEGIVWATDEGASVISMSLGYDTYTRVIGEAVEYAWGQDVVLVAGTGNDGNYVIYYPAAAPGCVAVGAVDEDGELTDYSNAGPEINCVAPGDAIYSTMPTYEDFTLGYLGWSMYYDYLDGTSMSTPMVSGLCALIRAADPGLTNAEVVDILERTCRDLETPGWDDLTGWGCIDMGRALREASLPTTHPPPGFINPLWNWISFPLSPIDTDPASIFGAENVVNRLFGYDPLRKTIILYPDDFVEVASGIGYVLMAWSDLAPSYQGHANPPDFGIDIPLAGWAWFGSPRDAAIELAALSVRNNALGGTRTVEEDRMAVDSWLNWNVLYWDSAADTVKLLSISGGDDTLLRPWYGYRIWSNTENLTLILP